MFYRARHLFSAHEQHTTGIAQLLHRHLLFVTNPSSTMAVCMAQQTGWFSRFPDKISSLCQASLKSCCAKPHHWGPCLYLPLPMTQCGERGNNEERTRDVAKLALELQGTDGLCSLAKTHLQHTQHVPGITETHNLCKAKSPTESHYDNGRWSCMHVHTELGMLMSYIETAFALTANRHTLLAIL